MKIEEAMVYLLATSQHGMKTEQIARELELRGLVPWRPGKPLDGKVIAAIAEESEGLKAYRKLRALAESGALPDLSLDEINDEIREARKSR